MTQPLLRSFAFGRSCLRANFNHFQQFATTASNSPLRLQDAQLTSTPQRVQVTWSNGNASVFNPAWLRDHAPNFRDRSSGQKKHSSADIFGDASRVKSVQVTPDSLQIVWEDAVKSEYFADWLNDHRPDMPRQNFNLPSEVVHWSRKDMDEVMEGVDYASYMNDDSALLKVLQQIHVYGLAFVKNAPPEDLEVEKIATRIGIIRETFYGRSWDVRSVPEAQNIAYTSVDLDFHQDLCYFEAPPGIQFLHMLVNEVRGGMSRFVDGFKVIELLKHEYPESYDILCKVPVTFHYNRGNNHLIYHKVTIEKEGRNEYDYKLNFSPPFQGILDIPSDQVEPFYQAFQRFHEIMHRPELIVELRMPVGHVALFNNRRVLHARTEFDPLEGHRHLKGTYIDLDEFRNRWRVLRGLKSAF